MATETTLYTILSDLRQTGRDGTVVVTDGESRKAIYFSRTGMRLLTSGKRRGVRIGEVLLKTGKISQRQLDMVLEKQQKSNLRFGELLYLMCMITEEDIKKAVRVQIEEEIYDLFTWEKPDVRFQEGPPPQELLDPDAPVTNLTFHVGALLEEATRRIKEWEGFRDKLPAKGMTLAKAPPSPGRSEAPLDDRSLSLLELCDGRRPLEGILEASPMFRFDTLKSLAFLAGAGRLASVRPTMTPAAPGTMRFGRTPTTGTATPGAMRMPSTGTPTPGGTRVPDTGSPTPGSLRTPSTGTPTPGALRAPSTGIETPGAMRAPSTGTPTPASLKAPGTPSPRQVTTGTPTPGAIRTPTTGTPTPAGLRVPGLPSEGARSPAGIPTPGATARFGPVATPGDIGERQTKEPSQRFSLDQVPDVDWAGKKPAQADEPPEPKPDTAPQPRRFLKKEETSRMMVRSAAAAASERLAPPPAAPGGGGGKAGWIAALLLLAAGAGAAGFEVAARRKFPEAESAARVQVLAGDLEGARRTYVGFARTWPMTTAAAAANRAAEDLAPTAGGGAAGVGSAAVLRSFIKDRLTAVAAGLPVEAEVAAAAQAEEWAAANGDMDLKDACAAWKARAEGYREEAAGLRAKLAEARAQGRLSEARELVARLAKDFPRAEGVRSLAWPFRVESSPAGASVFVNGTPAGTAPCVAEVPLGGSAAVRLESPGFEAATVDAGAPVAELIAVTMVRRARWTAKTSAPVTRAVAHSSATAFAVSDDGSVSALGLAAGNFLWRARPGSNPYVTPPVAARTFVYVGTQNGEVWALDAADGTALWHTPVGTGLRGSLSLSDDGTLLFAASDEGDITTLDATTGKNLGKVLLDAPVAHGPIGLSNTHWVAVLSDGTVRSGSGDQPGWATKLPVAPAAVARPTRAASALVCACADGTITALEANGTQRWSVLNSAAAPLGGAVDGDRVVVALSKRSLRCYDLATGDLKWKSEMGGDAGGPPAMAEGVVIVPGEDGLLRAWDAASGSVLWVFRAGSRIRGTLAAARETIVFGGEDGNVFAVPWK